MLSRTFIAKTRRMKGFIISFQWVNEEPAMCIMREFAGTKFAFVICLSSAYKYTDIAYLVHQSAQAADRFGMHGEKHAARNIADIILECLEDLVKMAPEPEAALIERVGAPLQHDFDPRTNTIRLHS